MNGKPLFLLSVLVVGILLLTMSSPAIANQSISLSLSSSSTPSSSSIVTFTIPQSSITTTNIASDKLKSNPIIQSQDAIKILFTNSGQRPGGGCLDVALGDLNGDGYLDAMVAGYYGSTRVYLNDGKGNFTDSSGPLNYLDGYSVALGDLDGNGTLDASAVVVGEAVFNTRTATIARLLRLIGRFHGAKNDVVATELLDGLLRFIVVPQLHSQHGFGVPRFRLPAR